MAVAVVGWHAPMKQDEQLVATFASGNMDMCLSASLCEVDPVLLDCKLSRKKSMACTH